MQSRNLSYAFRKLRVGFRLKCPNCEQAKMFEGRFNLKMTPTCPYCDVRYERSSGEAIGGVYINVAVAELTAMAGFFTVHSIFNPPILMQLLIWIPYLLVFIVLFYPRARGIWTSILWLTGAVYADPDYEREYIAPNHIPHNRAPQEFDN